MTGYRIQGRASDGETFYADGSDLGKVFATSEEALAYAMGYAETVGRVTFPDFTVDGNVALIRATKTDGYHEDIFLIDA